MDEQSIKLICKSQLKRRRDDLTWILEIIMKDYEIGYIVDQLKGRIRALKKQEKFK